VNDEAPGPKRRGDALKRAGSPADKPGTRKPPVTIPRLLAATLLLPIATAVAEPGYYVVPAYDVAGERSVDLRYWTVKPNGMPAIVWPEVGFGAGVNSRWYTEVYASWVGSWDEGTRLGSLDWQNDVLLTQGEWPFDLALHTTLHASRVHADGDLLEFGPALQTDVGRTQLNANVFFERDLGGQRVRRTRLQYQWQAKYRWRSGWHLGVQGFGEVGVWDDVSARAQQSHRAGPVVSSTRLLGEGRALKVDAAVLKGSTFARQGTMFSLRARYVFR